MAARKSPKREPFYRWQNNLRVHIMTSIRVSHGDENDPCRKPTEESVGWIHSSGSCRARGTKKYRPLFAHYVYPVIQAAACSNEAHFTPSEGSKEVSQQRKPWSVRCDLYGSGSSLPTAVVTHVYLRTLARSRSSWSARTVSEIAQ
jgi:hypothetical protein